MEKIILKNKLAIDKMRTAGRLLAQIMKEIETLVVVGVSTFEIDKCIGERMHQVGLKAECKGYAGYRFATCISINDGVIHGVPSKEVILKSGDFVKIDVVGSFKGYCADLSRYFFIGQVPEMAKKLAFIAQKALDAAVEKAVPGIRLSDISCVIQHIVEDAGFGIVRDFAGHGIGRSLHEAPNIPNYGRSGTGPILQEGMALAIEPMITEKSYKVYVMDDGWTVRTVDGGLAAHVEDTIVITKSGAEVLTRL